MHTVVAPGAADQGTGRRGRAGFGVLLSGASHGRRGAGVGRGQGTLIRDASAISEDPDNGRSLPMPAKCGQQVADVPLSGEVSLRGTATAGLRAPAPIL
jgi:hypothetical protein